MNHSVYTRLSLLALFMVMTTQVFAQPRFLNFRHFSTDQGLSNGFVTQFLFDQEGFMWVGTKSGLNRFNGYEFTLFGENNQSIHDDKRMHITAMVEDKNGLIWVGTQGKGLFNIDKNRVEFIPRLGGDDRDTSLSNTNITCLMEDKANRIWIGTTNGLFCYQPKSGKLLRYFSDPTSINSLSGNGITSIAEDENGLFWIGTAQSGLNRFDPVTGGFVRFYADPNDDGSLIDDRIMDISIDQNGSLWVGTEIGVTVLERPSMRFKQCRNTVDIDCINDVKVTCVNTDSKNKTWFGTVNGLALKLPDEIGFKRYYHDESNPQSISNNTITTVLETPDGNIWVGTAGEGINLLYGYSQHIETIRYNIGQAHSLSQPNVRDIFQDSRNRIWVATRGGGLDIFDFGMKNLLKNIDFDESDMLFNPKNFITCVAEDKDGKMWFGTQDLGVLKYDEVTGKLTRYQHRANDNNSLSDSRITFIHIDPANRVWIGTRGGGLNRFQPKTETFVHYVHHPDNPEGIAGNEVNCVLQNPDGSMWLGTDNGLSHFQPSKTAFRNYVHEPTDTNSLASNYIKTIMRDAKGTLWVGTLDGLEKWDREHNRFMHYNQEDGMANPLVYGILFDDENNVWCSTNHGITCLEVEDNTFRNYDVYDGLQGNEYNTGAYLQTSDGRFIFGGLGGLNIFHPDSLTKNDVPPKVVLTDFSLFNRSIGIGQEGVTNVDITTATELHLKHDHSVFTFEFAALNYIWSEKNQYAWLLEGFKEEWTNIGSRRWVTFTNLDPGTYVFRVKASNNNGIWNNEGLAISIHIHPAYYQTIWFRILVVGAIVLIVLFIIRWRVRTVKRTNIQLEELVSERTSEILKEKEAKEVLLKEIHHRVKNNLQVITSLLRLQSYHLKDEQALGHFEESQNRVISMALIHEKMYESHDLAHIDIKEYLEELTGNLIQSYRLDTKITLKLEVNITDLGLDTLTPLGLIVNEIISNALKYGFRDRDEGTIMLSLHRLQGRQIEMIIGDDGVGIDRSIDLENPPTLGLELIKTLVEQLEGTIEIQDRPGTVYKILLNDAVRVTSRHT